MMKDSCWEKMFAKHIVINGPVSKIHEEPLKLNSKKKKVQLENGQKIQTDISLKQMYRWRIKTRPKSSIALAIKEK